MQQFERELQIRHVRTTAFHLQSNGGLQRAHAVVKDLTKICVNDRQNKWDKILPLIFMSYNTQSMKQRFAHRKQSTILRSIRRNDLWSELMKMYNASARQLNKVQTIANTDRNRIHLNSQLIVLSALLDEIVRDIGTLNAAIAMGHRDLTHYNLKTSFTVCRLWKRRREYGSHSS